MATAFVYVYRGALDNGGTGLAAQRMALLGNEAASDGVVLRAAQPGTRALLVAGRPLQEPIAQYGPFVMNTREQVTQAVHDFQNGKLG